MTRLVTDGLRPRHNIFPGKFIAPCLFLMYFMPTSIMAYNTETKSYLFLYTQEHTLDKYLLNDLCLAVEH